MELCRKRQRSALFYWKANPNIYQTGEIKFNKRDKKMVVKREKITNKKVAGTGVHNIKFNKKKAVVAGIVIVLAALAVFIALRFIDISKKGITVAEAAKLISYAGCDSTELAGIEGGEGYWYEPYMDYIGENGYLSGKKPLEKVFYSDVRKLVDAVGADKNQIDVNLNKFGVISKEDFINVYMQLLPTFEYGNEVKQIEAGIAGTPSNISKTGEWTACTTEGSFSFKGLILDDKIDKSVLLVVRGKEILSVVKVVSDDVIYRNIWVKHSEGNDLYTNIYGADRTFYVENLSESVSQVLSDIRVAGGQVQQVNIKTDTIGGKVLSVSPEYVEIEKYGKVSLDDYFKIYDISNDFQIKDYTDIIVGYSLQDFVVAEGKICGAIISESLKADNIRVLVKTTGYKDTLHDKVIVTGTDDYKVSYGDVTEHKLGGEVLELDTSSTQLAEGRIIIEPESTGQIKVLNVERSQGNPEYEGRIEVSVCDNRLVIVNDINIEKYLKRVVPSEMPASFGTEALKVQAVCARSYAYRQLTNSHYGRYGAHVDDSTQYQVYNNTKEQESSNSAITQTRGVVLQYNGEVVQTYYYSTSCGTGTDVSVWGTAAENYPYFVSRDIGSVERNLDLTKEETFAEFIKNTYDTDYDSKYALYRWNIYQTVGELSASFNSKLEAQYKSTPNKILTMQKDGKFVSKSISDVGNIQDIIVNSRVCGGAAVSVTVVGSAATVRIESESCIRAMFGNASVVLTTQSDKRNTDKLPSAFCIFEKVYEGNTLKGFKITGGGYGHGIGMSQNAVKGMVDAGKKYDEILQFFYPGTALLK